jgi:HSP20 family protein
VANIVRFDPFAEMQSLQKQFFGDDWLTMRPRHMRLPTTDVYTEDDKQLVIEAHLPDFDQKDVNVSLDNGTLEIQAQQHERVEDKNKKYVVRESSSSFYRRIQLPERADASKINAAMDNGILKIIVPFKKLPSPKKVAISTGTKSKKK